MIELCDGSITHLPHYFLCLVESSMYIYILHVTFLKRCPLEILHSQRVTYENVHHQ